MIILHVRTDVRAAVIEKESTPCDQSDSRIQHKSLTVTEIQDLDSINFAVNDSNSCDVRDSVSV